MEQITKHDVYLFTQGGCHRLARVIHAHTGWPMFAFWNPGANGPADPWDIHAFVRTPRRTYFDIRGEWTPKEMHANWGTWSEGLPIRRIPPEVFEDLVEDVWNDDPDFDCCYDRAEELFPVIMKLYRQRQYRFPIPSN